MIVEPEMVEADLAAGRLRCPACDGSLARWGFARERHVRTLDAVRSITPRRACCQRCETTHVLLPAWAVPRRRDSEYFEAWRDGMRKLAAVENTVVKISGLGMVDHAWTVESLRPWVDTCIEAFGIERSFFGTNWPVDRLFSSYGDVIDAYAETIADYGESEQRDLFTSNARRIFHLE